MTTYLGKPLVATYRGEIVTHYKLRPEGISVRHAVGDNSIKMYDKQGSVLRVETTTNMPSESRADGEPGAIPTARPRCVLYARAQTCDPMPTNPVDRRKFTAKLSRHLRLLRAHGVIAKIEGTHRYRVTKAGRTLLTAAIAALDASITKLKQCA